MFFNGKPNNNQTYLQGVLFKVHLFYLLLYKNYKKNMKNVFKPLAELDFAFVLSESFAETRTGEELINKYRQYLLKNESTCQLVNNFLAEAKNYMYDSGVVQVVNKISEVVAENKISWKLATACEAINSNRSSYNYLNRNAAATVEKFLEHDESNVVKFIKAGALKDVMFCESFRNIVNSVFTDVQTIVTENYTAVHPVSFVEENDGACYFEVLGHIYSVKGNEISEAKASDVSGDFLMVSRLLESNLCQFDANAEKMTVDTPLAVYEICSEDGEVKCTRTSKKASTKKECDGKECKESITFRNESELREHNRLVVGATAYNHRNQVAELLESIARAFENFDKLALIDNTQIITNNTEKFVVIENKENVFAYSILTSDRSNWKINTTVVEALDFIKKRTNINISRDYKENIEEQIVKTEKDSAEKIKESIKNDEMAARIRKIEMLTEKFKNQPAKLAVLSKIAESLNE